MLKYKSILQRASEMVWKVNIINNWHPTVGDYIREIKKAKSSQTVLTKTITIYRKGLIVGKATFVGEKAEKWSGKASEFWSDPVKTCEMRCTDGFSYHYNIYIKEPREGSYACALNFISKFFKTPAISYA